MYYNHFVKLWVLYMTLMMKIQRFVVRQFPTLLNKTKKNCLLVEAFTWNKPYPLSLPSILFDEWNAWCDGEWRMNDEWIDHFTFTVSILSTWMTWWNLHASMLAIEFVYVTYITDIILKRHEFFISPWYLNAPDFYDISSLYWFAIFGQ